MDAESATAADQRQLEDLTPAITRMRRGMRRDVAEFVALLDQGGLYIALARPIGGTPIGEETELGTELTISPHLLPVDNDRFLVGLFSDRDLIETVGQYLDWTTEGDHLDVCCLPARVALDLALELIDEQKVVGALLNAGDDSELYLSRNEVASLAQGKAIPLVGYVREIPELADERTLFSELEGPLPENLTMTIREWADRHKIEAFSLEQSFNAERDLEPHLTLRLRSKNLQTQELEAIVPELMAALDGMLPPPGYLDVLLEPQLKPDSKLN